VSRFGLGCLIVKINNDQKVQLEGVCWSIYSASVMEEGNLEAGVCTDLVESRLAGDCC
jgi:hypothetical protein